MSYIKDQVWYTSLMDKGDTLGECANCHKVVKEYQYILDDCYGVYRGRCPHCNAVNLLDFSKGRGYTSSEIFCVLPTDIEIEMNKWEADIPFTNCARKECGGK
jgi:hypothetical protein